MLNIKSIVKNLVIAVIMLVSCFMVQESKVNADILNITNYEYKQDGTQVTNYSDNSFAVINTKENIYEFTPINFLGDWCYECETIEDLNALILDYKTLYDKGSLQNKLNTFGDIFVTNEYINNDGNCIKVFNDNSFVYINKYSNSYEFYPSITDNTNGTWCISFDNEKDLNNCIYTYISLICDGEY